ncbi:hypothetical protein G9A89_007942 [Geosiphon pyriformis]|nr:hypothetical protein G9A89_007942 [Geosiphon pyriformis]
MAVARLANNHGVVVNTDLKHSGNNHTNWAIVMKEIPVGTSMKAVHTAVSEFGLIKLIKMQLGYSTCNVDKQTWDSRDEFKMLLYTLSVGTNVHDLWDFVGSVGEKTYVIDCNPVSYVHVCCTTVCFGSESDLVSAIAAIPVIKKIGFHWSCLSLALCLVCRLPGHTFLNCVSVKVGSTLRGRKAPLSAQNQVKLVTIYAQKSMPIPHPLAFSSKTWGSVIGALPVHSSYDAGSFLGSDNVGKPLPSVVNDLEKHLVNIESGLISLAGQIGEDIVIGVGSGETIGDETTTATAMVKDLSASPHVVKLENMLEDLAALVLSLSAHFDGLVLAGETKLKDKVCPWMATKFGGVQVFFSGLNSGYVSVDVAIVMNNSLAKHVCKVSEVLGCLLCIRLFFKNKLLVLILGLYTGAFLTIQFSQAVKINSLIAKAVNESSFVILGGDFNEDGSHRCASFKKCFDLGLVNSLDEIVDCSMTDVLEHFDTDYNAVTVSVKLGGLLDVQLSSLCKQAASAANATVLLDAFVVAQRFSDLDELWDIIRKTMIFSADVSFKKKWFKSYDSVFTKVSSWFHKLELLVFKLVKASCLASCENFELLLETWNRLDSVSASEMKSLFLLGSSFNVVHFVLAKMRKSYHLSKLLKSQWAEESRIKQAIDSKIESFELDKGCTIRSVLEHPFCKVVLDHLIVNNELILEPELVKSKVDEIMEGWTQKHGVPLDYVFDGAFSDVIYVIGFDEMLAVVSNLPDGKAAGLSGISNKLWKHCNKLVLDMLLREIWVSMIPKLYEWEGVLTNTHSIVLIETAYKILSKILSDRISLACSKFDVLCDDNFSVLKGTTMQSLIFAIGSVVKNALKKNWELRSLVRIKMCNRFIRFFGEIYNGHINRVMTDFSLTNGYHVHDGLDQKKSVCGYRLNSYFISKTGQAESQAGLTSFFVAGAFVDDTIWIGSSQATTQHILNIASEFFEFNDISINHDKTVAILINCWVESPYLTVSGLPISITKKRESYCYLGIFLSSEGLSKPSLAKAHLDIQFFVNLVMRKTISDKHFVYLVSATGLNALIRKGLKSKSGLSHNFLSDAIYHPSLYHLKSFEQIQAESKSASVVSFANSIGILDWLFSYRFYDLQILSWCPYHFLVFPTHIGITLLNSFLAGVVYIFSGCDLSLDNFPSCAFHHWESTSMFLVLSKPNFLKCVFLLKYYGITFVKQLRDQNGVRLNPYGPVLLWFDLSVRFFSGAVLSSVDSSLGDSCILLDVCQSRGFGIVCDNLLDVNVACLSVYTDGSLSGLETCNMKTGAAVFFEDINSGLGMNMFGLVSSMKVELQAISLALECVPSFCSVNLFSDSQAALNACKSESLLVCSDFRNQYWIKCHHIANIIHQKNLDVNWIKVKGHSDILGNMWTDALTKDAAFSSWQLPHIVSEHFLKAGSIAISGISRYFVGSGSGVVVNSLQGEIDWSKSSLVWHLDSYMAAGFTSMQMAGFRTYFMKALYHHLPVVVHKCLYDKCYPSVVCLFCDNIEVSDHVFSCSFDAAGHAQLMDIYADAWAVCSGLSHSSLCVSQLLSICISNMAIGVVLCKGFVFNNLYYESVSVYKDPEMVVFNVVDFVCKYWAIMEKNKLIPHDGSVLVSVSGFASQLLAGVVKLLGVADVLNISFGFCKLCLFFAGINDVVSVGISAQYCSDWSEWLVTCRKNMICT